MLATFLFALSYPLARAALAEAGPLTVAGLRSFGGFLVELAVVLPVALVTGRALIKLRLRPSDWLLLTAIGILGYTAVLGLAYWGLRHTTPTTISLLVNLAPVFVLFIGWIGLREPPRPLQLAGMLVTCVGLFAFFGGFPSFDERAAVVAGLGSALTYSLSSLLSRKLRGASDQPAQMDALTLSAWASGIGGAIALVLAWPLEGLPQLGDQAGGAFVATIACLAALSTGLAYPLWNYSLGALRAFERDVLLAVTPAETALISWLFFDQSIAAHQVIGMSLALIGVVLVQVTSD